MISIKIIYNENILIKQLIKIPISTFDENAYEIFISNKCPIRSLHIVNGF